MKLANLAVLLAACGGAPAPSTTPASSPPSTPAPSPTFAAPAPVEDAVLRHARAELTVVGDETYVYTLAPDGLLSAMGDDLGFLTVPVARLSGNGELRRLDGMLAATITKDGSVAYGGKPMPMTIDEDGVVTNRGEVLLAIGPDGAASGPLAKRGMSYQGDADARRALLFGMTAAMSMLVPSGALDAPSEAPASTTIAACDTYRTAAARAQACSSFDAAWGDRITKGIARVNRYAATPPVEGVEAAARSCVRATERLKAVLATTTCAP